MMIIPKLFIVQYPTEVPLHTREFPPGSTKWKSGSDEPNGIIHLELRSGQTAHFGAWVEWLRVVDLKRLINSLPFYEPWCPEHAITFSEFMPEKLAQLQREEDIEKALQRLNELKRPKIKDSPWTVEERQVNEQRLMANLRIDYMASIRRDLNHVYRRIDEQVEAGDFSKEEGKEMKEDATTAFDNIIDGIAGRIGSQRRA